MVNRVFSLFLKAVCFILFEASCTVLVTASTAESPTASPLLASSLLSTDAPMPLSFSSPFQTGLGLERINGLLAAFGDFNSDKLTDLFLITGNGYSFEIIKQNEKNVDNPLFDYSSKLTCSTPWLIRSLIPSDFNGDAMMDVLLVAQVSKENDTLLGLNLVSGYREHLNCSQIFPRSLITITNEPVVLDMNGDMISDLLAQDINGTWKVWFGQDSNKFLERSFPLDGRSTDMQQIANQRVFGVNAFIDLNGDQVADIFFDLNTHMEYWFAEENGYLKRSLHIRQPTNSHSFGSSTFFDINGDGKIDHLVPVCWSNSTCSILGLITDQKQKHTWIPVLSSLHIGNDSCLFHKTISSVRSSFGRVPISMKFGDVDGDGFPDLLSIVQCSSRQENPFVGLFINRESSTNAFGRTFDLMLLTNDSLHERPEVAALFDLYEDGKLDVLFSGSLSKKAQASSIESITTLAILNTQQREANFFKVLITSGLCLERSCYDESLLERGYRVPYGTNKGGPSVCYQLIDANGNEMKSCAGQYSQTAHFSLQLPYCLFGLGRDSNYIDHINITYPTGNTSLVFTRFVQQIVPDSQIVVVPHPLPSPSDWVIQLFVTPSEIIYKTLYTFLGICLILLILISFLTYLEHRHDKAEHKQYRSTWPDRRR